MEGHYIMRMDTPGFLHLQVIERRGRTLYLLESIEFDPIQLGEDADGNVVYPPHTEWQKRLFPAIAGATPD